MSRTLSLCSLPLEIISRMLYFAVNPASYHGSLVVRVCRTFNEIGEKYLWEKFVIGSERSRGFIESADIEGQSGIRAPSTAKRLAQVKSIKFNFISTPIVLLVSKLNLVTSDLPNLVALEFAEDLDKTTDWQITKTLVMSLCNQFSPRHLIWNVDVLDDVEEYYFNAEGHQHSLIKNVEILECDELEIEDVVKASMTLPNYMSSLTWCIIWIRFTTFDDSYEATGASYDGLSWIKELMGDRDPSLPSLTTITIHCASDEAVVNIKRVCQRFLKDMEAETMGWELVLTAERWVERPGCDVVTDEERFDEENFHTFKAG